MISAASPVSTLPEDAYVSGVEIATGSTTQVAEGIRRWAGISGHAFWRAQAGGWLMLGIVYFLALLPQSQFSAWSLLTFKIFWASTGIGVSTTLAVVYDRGRVSDRRLPAAVAIAVASSLVFGSSWVLGLGSLVSLMTGSTVMLYTANSFPFVALNHFLIILSWSLAYLTLAYWHRSQEEQRKSVAALSAAREAQLAMLRYQLNPHFLFNAMTSVRALITEHPERARATLSRLASFLRYTLGNSSRATVSVAEEVQVVRDYLEIELVRFEERLDIDVSVDVAAAKERIPGFLLHPLIENAIKHGTSGGGALRVRVGAHMDAGTLRIEVANTGTLPAAATTDPGIGVANVRARLARTYPGRHRFEIAQDGEWVRAVVKIDPATGRNGDS